MGCATSKLDDLPAVALCRDRRAFLDEAVQHRFAFAEAHAAYLQSLKAVGLSLDRFFKLEFDAPAAALGSGSPFLNLPPRRKEEPRPIGPSGSPPVNTQHHLQSRSDSGSHLHLDTESEDDDSSGSASSHHHDARSPADRKLSYGASGGFMTANYMKKQTTPSLAYTQLPISPETMHMGESSASSSSFYPYYNHANNLNYNSNNSYQNYSNYGGGGSFGGFSTPAVASSSRPPPAPPSPPRSSTWDFLNPFDTFENNYPANNPRNDYSIRKVKEEEGIPDLEDEDDKFVEEVHGLDQKFVDGKRNSYSKSLDDDGVVVNDVDLQHMVYKNATDDAEDKLKVRDSAIGFKSHGGNLEAVKEIRVQFERASDSGSELAKFLEVGKLPYKWKRITLHASSKIFHLPVMSLQHRVTKSYDNADPVLLDVDQDVELQSKNLSSTLYKLYLWETKLYDEVKAEEKMRVLHEQKSRKTKHMDEKGAEALKVEAAKSLVRSLSTKIKIAIQVVDKISVKINTLRDEELWPRLNEFIHGLARMWKSMLECHRNQCRAIGNAKKLDAIAFHKNFSDAHYEATRQLEHDLVNWTLGFSNWVGAQKGFVRALNNWLMKYLLYVPEETPDGIAPFSPGRIGAPLVFVICHQWSQLLDSISEKEVVNSMRDFASDVLQLWGRDKAEMRQRMVANKDERKIKSLEKEDQQIQKEINALDKRIFSRLDNGIPLTGRVVYPSETTKEGSFQASLQHVFEAMGTFTANSLKVYEELLQQIEEEHLAGENGKVS